MVQQHDMPTLPPLDKVGQRTQEVRGRLWRTVLPLMIAAAFLCGLVVWQRDSRHIESAKARLSAYVLHLATKHGPIGKQEMRGGQYYYSWDWEHRCCSRVCLRRYHKTGKTYRPDPPEAA